MENESSTSTSKKGISPILIGIIIVILVVGGAAAYTMLQKNEKAEVISGNEKMEGKSRDATTPSEALSPAPSDAMSAEASVKTFEIDGSNFKFEPSTVSVKQGDKIKVVFKSTAGFHDFNIEGLVPAVATKQIGAGESETVEFTASKKGTFKYYCSVGKHRAQGMEGTLTVN